MPGIEIYIFKSQLAFRNTIRLHGLGGNLGSPFSFQGKFSKKPFVKFICHSTSYIFFLLLLALASQRAEMLIIDIIGKNTN